MNPVRKIGRRFPDYGWAWPTGDLDRLLKAVLGADEDASLQAALGWLNDNDINDVEFREQRLLAAVSERFGKRLAESPAYPRLVGLQRLLWSRSRLTLHEAREALGSLVGAGIPCMLIKGASRIALAPEDQRGRISHDVDVLVAPRDIRRTFQTLIDLGWQAATGASAMRLVGYAGSFRAMNFFKGRYGDLDAHQKAYHSVQASADDDDALWRRAIPVSLYGIPVLVPSAGDRIAIAVAHGGLDAHTHSDWLVDIHKAAQTGDVDWPGLLVTLSARHLAVPAAVALTYLAWEIGSPVPQDVVTAIVALADKESFLRRMGILECKPRTDFNAVSGSARGLAKQLRLWKDRSEPDGPSLPLWRTRIARPVRQKTDTSSRSSVQIPVSSRSGILEIVLLVNLPEVRRRVELEISTPSRLVATLRYRKLSTRSGLRQLTFRGPIELAAGEDSLLLEARPSRFAPVWQSPEEAERYAALPFSVSSVSFR